MESSSYVPKGVRMIAERLAGGGMARNRIRIESQGASSVNAGQIISFSLPEGVIDLKSFKIHARVKTTESANSAETVKVIGKLPADASSLIARLEIQASGQQLTHASSEFNSISRVLKLCKVSHAHDHSVERLLSHSEHKTDKAVDDVSLVFMNLYGLFSDSSVRYLDSSLIGPIVVRISLAGPEVITAVSSTGSAVLGTALTTDEAALPNPTFSASEIYSTVDVLSMPEIYSQLVRERLATNGSISFNYKDFLSFSLPGQSGDTASISFNLSAQSLDKIYVVMRDSSYNAGTPNPGFKLSDEAVAFGDANLSSYFRFRTFDSTSSHDGTASYQFNLNNVSWPQYRMRVSDALYNMAYCADIDRRDGLIVQSRLAAHQAYGVFICPLSLTDEGVGLLSGYDCRGVNSTFRFDAQGLVSGEKAVFAVAEVTKTLVIGPGQQLSIMH